MQFNKNSHTLPKGNMDTPLVSRSTIHEGLSGRNGASHDKLIKLTNSMFFEFMKTAYEVNDSFSQHPIIEKNSNEIDWSMLSNIDFCHVSDNPNVPYTEAAFASVVCQDENLKECNNAFNKLHDNSKTKHGQTSRECPNNQRPSYVKHPSSNGILSNDKTNHQGDNYNKHAMCINSTNEEWESEEKHVLHSGSGEDNILPTMVKTNLSNILHEGLLDSVLPYMIPDTVMSQSMIKKSIATTEIKKSNSSPASVESKTGGNLIAQKENQKENEKIKINKKTSDTEVEIHVFDEDKNIRKNFRCPQKLLIKKMCYFADVTSGQKLEEMDISVHCDVVIFDWLMRWVKKDVIKKSDWPVLEASNVIPIMVSASFLQMEPLLESCLEYCHANISDILKTSSVLTCLDENILTSLAEKFTNEDVEGFKDKRDKIQSKLFWKLIVSLSELTPDNKKGHYSSLAMLFKCSKCGKKIIQSISTNVPCIATAMAIDHRGHIQSRHSRDITWTLNDYVMTLRTELRSWRKVYWRLWGDCHFLFCQECNTYFPINQIEWCCYHPELPQFFINEQQRPTPYPLGRFPCCSQTAYKFEVLPNREGCRYKEHTPAIRTQGDVNVLNILTAHKDIIFTEPPKLYFPEKITRLAASEPSVYPLKLECKTTMWWTGIEVLPPRPKLGLLRKIWSGPNLKQCNQYHESRKSFQKFYKQISIDTSATSSATDSDEGDKKIMCTKSSEDDDSYYSDDFNVWTTQRGFSPSWSQNLNVRHNQDNQRDFEEKVALQMIALLTKRVSTDTFNFPRTLNKHNWKRIQPAGGKYVKLEAEFREQMAQSCKCKGLNGKVSLRPKSNK